LSISWKMSPAAVAAAMVAVAAGVAAAAAGVVAAAAGVVAAAAVGEGMMTGAVAVDCQEGGGGYQVGGSVTPDKVAGGFCPLPSCDAL